MSPSLSKYQDNTLVAGRLLPESESGIKSNDSLTKTNGNRTGERKIPSGIVISGIKEWHSAVSERRWWRNKIFDFPNDPAP